MSPAFFDASERGSDLPSDHPDHPDRVIIRDKRRIDPVTGAVRQPDPDPVPEQLPAPVKPAEVEALEASLAERTADLQRLQAEYANYRRRVQRDQVTMGEVAVGGVLAALLPVLDDLDRARLHGDLSGAAKAVDDQLHTILTRLGLQSFGDAGDAFDPTVHEAVTHNESDEVTRPTATLVMRRGYKHGDRLLRPAMVGVTEPVDPTVTADAVDGA